MNEDFKIQVSIKVVLYNQEIDKFLLMQRSSTREWGFVGGSIHNNENIFETLKREVAEEIGHNVKYKVDDIIYAKRRKNKYRDFMKIAYLAFYEGGEIILSKEHSKYNWVSVEDILAGQYSDWVKENIVKAQKRLKI